MDVIPFNKKWVGTIHAVAIIMSFALPWAYPEDYGVAASLYGLLASTFSDVQNHTVGDMMDIGLTITPIILSAIYMWERINNRAGMKIITAMVVLVIIFPLLARGSIERVWLGYAMTLLLCAPAPSLWLINGVRHRIAPLAGKSVAKGKPAQFRQLAIEDSATIWTAFVEAWGPVCWYCGQVKSADRRELQLDHVEPNARDGTNDDCWNRAVSCSPCNSDKSNRLTPDETIRMARKAGRIATDNQMAEQMAAFQARMAWARRRWNEEVKP